MKMAELVRRLSERSGVGAADVRAVLRALPDVVVEALSEGEEVTLRGLCTIGSRWREARTVRSIRSRRRMVLDGRFVVRYNTAARVKRALAERTPQLWHDPEHQKAWRVAEALIGDLVLYHGARAPTALSPSATTDEVAQACAEAFGQVWSQVLENYSSRIPERVRSQRAYLALAAREQWKASDDPEA